jgi:hypothetical protein
MQILEGDVYSVRGEVTFKSALCHDDLQVLHVTSFWALPLSLGRPMPGASSSGRPNKN